MSIPHVLRANYENNSRPSVSKSAGEEVILKTQAELTSNSLPWKSSLINQLFKTQNTFHHRKKTVSIGDWVPETTQRS